MKRLIGNKKVYFYVPRRRQEFLNFLLNHSNVKPYKLRKYSLDKLRKIYYAIRCRQVEAELETSLAIGKRRLVIKA